METSKLNARKPAASMSATLPNNLVLPDPSPSHPPATRANRGRHRLPIRSIREAPHVGTRIQCGTDVLDFMSFPQDPHAVIAGRVRRIWNLLPGYDGSEYPGDPNWHKFVLTEALKVVNDVCPTALQRRVLKTSQGTPAKCHLIASLIPAQYFPESGTVVDRFFVGLISFLEKEHRFTGQHATDMEYQQEDLSTTLSQKSNVGRGRMGTHRSGNQSKRRKIRQAAKVKQEVTASQCPSETPSQDKSKTKTEISPDKAVQTSYSRKRKSLDAEMPIQDSIETPSKKKKQKKKKAEKTSIEPIASPTPTPSPKPRVVIKLEDSSDDESAYAPQQPKKRLNVYENMYHDAREEIRFFEKFLLHGAGMSKSDIEASKTRVAMGQTYRRAFEQVSKLPEKKLARRPNTPEQN